MRSRWLLAGAALTFSTGCADLRPVLARPLDLEDYRAFRVAAADGTRLARAKRYLERHPDGRWASEVRASFEEEEPRLFARAQASREGLRRYLADLPDGPHAGAALALLVAFGSSMEDAELGDLARRVRSGDVALEAAAVQRRAVGTAILDAVGVFLDDDVHGATLAEAPTKLSSILLGPGAPTWGAVASKRESDYFFVLPTRPVPESRLLTLSVAILEANGSIVGGRVEGSDMFVRWAEADTITRLDSSEAGDRTDAQVHAMTRLEGAFERRFPSASCPEQRAERELYHRACDGWEAVVTAGARAGDNDVIVIRAARGRTRVP